MIKKFKQPSIIILLFFILPINIVFADHQSLIMGRSLEAFPETMSNLQTAIKKAGYTISKIQRVDIGLTGMGFKTDKYRVIFFGKTEEIIQIPKKYPQLTPYLPLAISIFSEEQETVLTAMSPAFIAPSYNKKHPELASLFIRWEKDIRDIIHQVCYESN
jgi:uncharacterized protein (DUF302 family)